MLKGEFIYKTHKYKLNAVDSSDYMNLYMRSHNANDIAFMGDNTEDTLDERKIQISQTKITVETPINVVNNKKVKAPINKELFTKLGVLIRYAKQNCHTKNEEGYTGLKIASGEFLAKPKKTYIIPYPKEPTKQLARVVLYYGDILELDLNTDDISIHLEEDISSKPRLFGKPKDGIQLGFKFDYEHLGFEQNQKTISNNLVDGVFYNSIEEIIEANPHKEFRWLLQKNYILVTDDILEDTVKYILDHNGLVYYDTETTGLNINFYSREGKADQLVGVVLSVKYGESFFFPCQMNSIPNLCAGDHHYFMEYYMRPILEGKDIVCHNAPFDWKVAYIYGINTNVVHDTMAILHLTFGAEYKNFKVGLKPSTKLLLNRDSLELSDLVRNNSWGEVEVTFADLPPELVKLYACADTDNTNGLLGYATQNNLLAKYNATKVYEIEILFGLAVAYQEFYGHRLDINNIKELRAEIERGQAEEMAKMEAIVGHSFNPNSSPQLLKIMYKELGIPEQTSRKTGNPTTDKDTLKKLSEYEDIDGNKKYPFVSHLLKYREYEGVRKIIDKAPEYMTEEGYLFSEVQQYGTTTGRVSIKEPNYQSYNDPVKKNIIPRPGFWMFDTDYSSVEYRVLGNMVGNKRIMTSFQDPDFDYHAYQASHMYGVPYSAVTKKLRKAAKGINFGLPYGMGDPSLGAQIFGEVSDENTKQAAKLREAYFKGQEDIKEWFETNRDLGVNRGYTETYFGRRRYYRKEDFSESAIRRQAGNQIIQGCVCGDTLINTKEHGICKIGTLVDQTITVWDGSAWSSGFVAYSGKKRKCIVTFNTGMQIVCSPDHKFEVISHKGNSRFVRCEDLISLQTSKSAHRVRVNTSYDPSDHKYNIDTSEFISNAPNANNIFINTLSCSSFDKGVVLGRLASDGNYNYKEVERTSTTRILQVIAEHEIEVADILEQLQKEWGSVRVDNPVRENRTQAIAHIKTFSTSLTKELQYLDIRHSIHSEIFKDTEMLRGFLRGLFDGDGGISGRTIIFTQGTQYNFEPMLRDIQKALLFFGVRSYYRTYPDRYIIQIRVKDIPVFLDRIGFINSEKQAKGYTLKCSTEEKIFGASLMVESVEFTDEYIDMYDVCNTDRGYFVANGVVTHNSSADIYKLAVGRVFRRICKEGWLGKVMLTAFVHDELLGEVSDEINPAVWLKILREEFEVQVYNDDGSPWCPLYMGFGYGMNWYDAKTIELPIKLQWELVKLYGDNGFPDWDGDGATFFKKIPDMLRDFEVRDIRQQLLDPSNQGKEIKPTLNNQLLDCCKYDIKHIPKAVAEYGDREGLLEYLDREYHIQNVIRGTDGSIITDLHLETDTQKAIDMFCKLHNVDRFKVDILNISDVEVNVRNTNAFEVPDEYIDYDTEDEDKKAALKAQRVAYLGYYIDIDTKEITLRFEDNKVLNDEIKKLCTPNGDYAVFFKDVYGVVGQKVKDMVYPTQARFPSNRINSLSNLYSVVQYKG